MSARTGRLILQGMILLAALTWLAALALAEPAGAQQGGGQGQGIAAVAAQAQIQKAAQPSPFAGPEDGRLSTWTGTWEETVKFAGDADDKAGSNGHWRAMPFWGLYVVINYESKAPEGNYHAHAVMAYDHEAKVYRLWWFDDGANISEYTGNWKDEATLVFESKRTTGGKVFRERITYTKPSDDEIHTKIEQAFGTEPLKVYSQAEAHRMALTDALGGGNQQRQQQQQQRKRPQQPSN
jgi:Protein of unknown function (DUF1579)